MAEFQNETLSEYRESLKLSTRNFARRLNTILIDHRIFCSFNLKCISQALGSLEDIENVKTVIMSVLIPVLGNDQFYNIIIKTGVGQQTLMEKIWEVFLSEFKQLDLTEEDKESFISALVRTPTEG